jgi:hypothetical protein
VENTNAHLLILIKQQGSNNPLFKRTPSRNVNASVNNLKRNVLANAKANIKGNNMFIKKGTMIHNQFKQYIKQISKENTYNKTN